MTKKKLRLRKASIEALSKKLSNPSLAEAFHADRKVCSLYNSSELKLSSAENNSHLKGNYLTGYNTFVIIRNTMIYFNAFKNLDILLDR